MGTFIETRAPTSRKYIAEQGTPTPNWSNTFQTFWSHSSVFGLEKQSEKLNFQSFFTSKKPFGGYFQWNACTYSQKICIWKRYSNATLIKNISKFLVGLLRFWFRKRTWKANFSEFFTLTKHFGGYFQWNVCTYFQEICSRTRYTKAKFIKYISKMFGSTLPFFL